MDRVCENCFYRTRTSTSLNTNDVISSETKRPGGMNSGLMKVSQTESWSQLQAFSVQSTQKAAGEQEGPVLCLFSSTFLTGGEETERR